MEKRKFKSLTSEELQIINDIPHQLSLHRIPKVTTIKEFYDLYFNNFVPSILVIHINKYLLSIGIDILEEYVYYSGEPGDIRKNILNIIN